jgi:hypothetical protein
VGITVTTPDGTSLDRDLGEVAQTAKGQVPIDAKVLCPDGCRLAGLWLRGTDQFTADRLDYDNLDRVMQMQGRVRGTLAPPGQQ